MRDALDDSRDTRVNANVLVGVPRASELHRLRVNFVGVFEGIPIIGIAGGIGSGKSYVARLFAERGCVVIDSDAQVAEAYQLPLVRDALRQWWGEGVFQADGSIDRKAIARKIFSSVEERRRLEGLLHPVVAQLRDEKMLATVAAARAGRSAMPVAFVWDTPLLFESGLNVLCDAVVFVETSRAERLRRVRETRRWDENELTRRENSQWPLDKKRSLSHHVVVNTASGIEPVAWPSASSKRQPEPAGPATTVPLQDQVGLVLSRIVQSTRGTPASAGV